MQTYPGRVPQSDVKTITYLWRLSGITKQICLDAPDSMTHDIVADPTIFFLALMMWLCEAPSLTSV